MTEKEAGKADEREFPVLEGAGIRLDVFLAGKPGLTRNQAQRLITEGRVIVSGVKRKANYRLRPGESVKVALPALEPLATLPEDIPLDIIYYDDDVIVVNKPAGIVVHPASGNYSGTLVNGLLNRFGDLSHLGGDFRPGVVHRLDKDTSGVIVFARNDHAHRSLAAQFKAHTNVREYVAVAVGKFKDREGAVSVSIGRHITDRKKMSPVTLKGHSAMTRYRVISQFGPAAAFISLGLTTGRTHQIRVHMAHIGHPLAGDRVYGAAGAGTLLGMKVPRQMLHARLLGFIHPSTGAYAEFESDIPEDMKRLLEFLGRKEKIV
ncbi:MAG: RluA family pseudouridine synthase [Nitrospirota bacterium]